MVVSRPLYDQIRTYGTPENITSQEKEKKTGREYVGSTPDGVFLATEFLRKKNDLPKILSQNTFPKYPP